jgi:hypothetical protein
MERKLNEAFTALEEQTVRALLHSSIIEQKWCYPKGSVIVASH